MGTALTDRHVRQLSRLTHNLWLCFDGDAAGEAATLRGMELAAAEGLVIKVIALPADQDPADLAAGFERRLADADPYLVHRVRIEIDRAADRQDAFLRVREVLSKAEDSPERQDAVRLAADRLDLPSDLQAGLASRTRAATGSVSPKVLQAGDRLERDALAGCLAHRQLVASLAELEPEAFDAEQHRALRAHLIQGGELPCELVALVAELDARAVAEQIDERTSKELLLRLTERDLRRQLARTNGDLSKTLELQEKLERVRKALDALS
jgi:DNA primase